MSITIDTFKGRPTTDFEKRNIRKTNYAYGMTMLTSLTSPTILWDYSPQQHLRSSATYGMGTLTNITLYPTI